MRKIIKGIVKQAISFGLNVDKKINYNKIGYERVLPAASYAPWTLDKEFLDVYKQIKTFTLVDKYRCWELWHLVEQSKKINGSLIEIGIWRGGTGALICKQVQFEGMKKKVFLADTFTGVVKAGHKDAGYKGGEHSDTTRQTVELLLRELKVNNFHILEGIFPDETGNLIKNERFSFCHIDVDVYESAKDVFDWIWPRMNIGGIVVFDDYGFQGCNGITEFVNGIKHSSDRIMLHNLNGHAVFIKINNEY